MERYLSLALKAVLGKKIILLSGPRQVGKTTLARDLDPSTAYYNYDIKKDSRVFLKQEWDREKSLVVFDELHKMRKWKLWLKGLYDDDILKKQKVLVTGSARLDIVKRAGDSLAGRFYGLRLHPLDLKELKGYGSLEKNYQQLITLSGFPEPFLSKSPQDYRLWSRSHLDVILRQDLLSLENIRDLDGIEVLVELLAQRVGSLISFNSLAGDLGRDDKTIKRWVGLLEDLYVIFRVPPFAKNISRALKKSCKFYFFDTARVQGGEAQKLENLVALSLLKELNFQEDVHGHRGRLQFIRTRNDKEIDFVAQSGEAPPLLIEVKLSETQVSSSFELAKKALPNAKCLQLVKNLDREFTSKNGVRVCRALNFLEALRLR